MSAHAVPRKLERAGDAELVTMTRKGDTDAYATLFRRHASAAASVARSVTNAFEPDDLVSEAYARILQALQAGNGPTAAFRPYLFTTVRNIAASWGRAGKDAVPLEPEELESLAVHEDDALAVLDRSLTAKAFRSLPPRWQEALWYSEVEGMQPAELAPLLGMRAQAAAALCYRAREGLRQAWISAHLSSANLEPECAWTVERLAAHARGRLSKHQRARVDAHLATCQKCAMAAAEAEESGSRIALVLLPLLLGSGAAAAYAASTKAGVVAGASAAGATAAGVGTFGASGSGGAQGAGAGGAATSGGGMSGGAGVLIGIAAGVVVVAGAVAGVLIASAPGRSSEVSPSVQHDSFDASGSAGSTTAEDAPSSPSATPAPTTAPTPNARQGSAPPSSGSTVPLTAGAGSQGATPATPGVPTSPTAPGTPTAPSTPTSPGTPTSPPDPVVPAPPTIVADTGGGRYLPIVSGTALPGATVTVVGGGTTTTAQADASGAWRVPGELGDYAVGTGTVSAWQTDADGGVSVTASASFTLTAPRLSVRGFGSSHSPLVAVRIGGASHARVELVVDGASRGIRTLDGSGSYVRLELLGRGGHDIAVLYVDGSGRLGVAVHASVTVG
jgi:RNA polymerase sigma factor (sigma-70 family)